MALTDSLSGDLKANIDMKLSRAGGYGHTGTDSLARAVTLSLTDGTGVNQATGFFSASFTATTGGITIELGNFEDPLGAAGDDVPTEDPATKDLRGILIENTDTTNYITLGLGTNALANWLGGTTPTVRIPAGGILLAMFPIDQVTLDEAGSKDEIKITANTASCIVRITYIFG